MPFPQLKFWQPQRTSWDTPLVLRPSAEILGCLTKGKISTKSASQISACRLNRGQLRISLSFAFQIEINRREARVRIHNLHWDSCEIFFRFYLLIFRERGREGEKEGEKHQCERKISVGCLPLVHPPTGDRTHNPLMCSDWESNWQPFAL